MSIFSQLTFIPYATSRECTNQLHGIEAIDYFFARQIFSAYQNSQLDLNTHMSATQYGEVFHILLALSHNQRQGSVCLSLDTLANAHQWTNDKEDLLAEQTPVAHNTAIADESMTSPQGFNFSHIDVLQKSITHFIDGLANTDYLVWENSLLYSKRYWQYEDALCRFIAGALPAHTVQMNHDVLLSKKALLNETMGHLFATPIVNDGDIDFQQLSVLNSLGLPFSIITGGAGTGKTYTITRLAILISVLSNLPHYAIEMAAPTGKAANRMAQSLANELEKLTQIPQLRDICEGLSKVQPKTINRLLKTNPTTGQSAYGAKRPLPAKLIIIDETSMIDISLMYKLINSLTRGSQLILVGDPNQLPSVETGCLLADLVDHPFGNMPASRWQSLCDISPNLHAAGDYFRQHLVANNEGVTACVNSLFNTHRSHDNIDKFAKAILAGDAQKALSYAHTSADEPKAPNDSERGAYVDGYVSIQNALLPNQRSAQLLRSIEQMLSTQVLPNLHPLLSATSPLAGFTALQHYALLTPFRQSYVGTASLNQLIEQQLKHHYPWVRPGKLYKCKPIMIMQNDYQLSLFNGDIGIVWENDQGELLAYFMVDKSLVAHKVYNLPAFDVNYAMTIHKTQGSEFARVDIVLPPNHMAFLNKQLLYTGVTRARQNVRIFASNATFSKTINTSAQRISGIQARLSDALTDIRTNKIE